MSAPVQYPPLSVPQDQDPYARWRFQKELPEDRTTFSKAWKLLESYSGLPRDQIEEHVVAVVS